MDYSELKMALESLSLFPSRCNLCIPETNVILCVNYTSVRGEKKDTDFVSPPFELNFV